MITIILPVRNEGNYIKDCIEAILRQDFPQDQMEIIVVDGLSTDNTREITRDFQRKFPNIFFLDNPGKIVPIGMNIALRKAKGEVVIRVDGHCIIAKDYFRKCVDYLSKGDIEGVGGPMESIGETKLAESIALAMSSIFGVGNSAFRTTSKKTLFADTVPFPAYTNKVIKQNGLYDEELVRNQDDEYNYRIREKGGRLLLAEDIQSKYYTRGTLKKLWKQYFQYGFYKVRVLQKHPRQMSIRQFVPPLFVLGFIISIFCTLAFGWGWILLSSIFGSYLLANFSASISLSLSHGWRHLLVLPVAFLIIHLGYGFGFLFGLVKYWNRWSDKVGKVPPN